MASMDQEREQVQEARNAGNSQDVPAQAPGAEGGPERAGLPLELGSLTVSGHFVGLALDASGAGGDRGDTSRATEAIPGTEFVMDSGGTVGWRPGFTFTGGWSGLTAREGGTTAVR